MAKNKLRITDIQKALLTNTRFIKEQEEEVVQESIPQVTAATPPVPATFSPPPVPSPATIVAEAKPPEVLIDPKIMKRMKILAAYQKTTPGELINSALDHYLKLKAMQLEEAMHKLTTE
jgi:hypothetical protein